MPFQDLDDLRTALGEPAKPSTQQKQLPLVFVVDDDSGIRASLELLLQPTYRVKAFGHAADAVEAINNDVAVVILDVKMSGVDGFSAYKQMREKDPDLPIIFYSAYQDIKDPYEILNEYRPFGYLTKGEDYDALLRSIGAAVELRGRTLQYRGLLDDLSNIQAQMEALRTRIVGRPR